MGRFLTEVAGFANTPALLGSVELVEGEQRSAIGIVNAFVMNQGDAWTVSAAYLDRFVDEQRLLSSGGDAAESEEQVSYLRYMSQAGRRLAEMHVALASGKDVPDFEPVAVTPEDFEFWIDDVMACVSRVFDAFRQPRRVFSEADRPLINQLLAEHAGLPDRLRALLPRDIDCLNIRHHGNLHLGQLLIVKDDIFIIDFEGDPERSIAERRRKAPAARDVAGLIRSIDCSTTATLERGLKATPDEHEKLANALEGWRDHATEAFLTAYSETVEGHGLWPSRADSAEKLLNFFLIEKAFHEIEHGLTRRPDWLRVPLTGMLRLLSPQSNEV